MQNVHSLTMQQEEISRRAALSEEYFRQGYNCSQSVFLACCDLFGLTDKQLALRVSSSFGGGIGRMRSVCGAASGMFLLEGLRSGNVEGSPEAKQHNYAEVQSLAARFRDQHGSLICAEILGLAPRGEAPGSPMLGPKPEARTEEYYHKRPCVETVSSAVRIFLEHMQSQEE